MKKLVVAIFFLFIAIKSQAQSYTGKGDSKINIAYNIYGYGNGIKATYDIGLSNLFSIGAGASYYFNNDINDYFIFVRTNLHLGPLMDLPPELDIYPGFSVGYLSSNYIGLAGYVGVRYFFNDKIGIYTELGSSGAVGISVFI